METTLVLGLAALAVKLTSFVKYLTARHFGEALTQLVTWGAALAAVAVYAHSDFANGVSVSGHPLASLNFAAQLVVALGLGSVGSFAYDLKKAHDGTDSAAEPPLGGSPVPPVA